MAVEKLPKAISNKIGRAFALLFNRSMMYSIDHPFTSQALSEFYQATTHGLTLFSPVVLILHQEQFFIEEEPLDPRINTSKMLQHFKKADIRSISFELGLQEILKAPFALHKVPFDIRPAAGSSELLFFSVDFMVDMAPTVLVPAPQRGFLRPQAFEVLPASAGQPRRDHGQTQGNPVAPENIHQSGKIFSGYGHVVGPKKNVTGALVPELFQSAMNTAFGSIDKIRGEIAPNGGNV